MSRFLSSLILTILVAGGLLAAPAAHGASPDIVVSQVSAGGGNADATYTHDFVELFNRGATAIDVSAWTIQYASATGTTWQATPLSGSIQPGRYYLVQLASAAAVGSPLPTPDATGTTNLANAGGKVAVVRDATLLTCGASAGSCSANPQVADLIGWGSAADFEGSGPAPALSNTTADLRAASGCTDTDDNAADFDDVTPAPRSSSTPASSCGSTPPPPSGGGSESATVDIDILPALSIALERSSLSFGNAAGGETPAPLSQGVTVTSNGESGYALTVHRSAFLPADLPLGLTASAPSGGQLGGALAGGAMAPIPIAPAADLLVGTTAAQSAPTGDTWATNVGFVSPLPNVAAGRYTATVTFSVIGQ
jgi:Lamin Tail Domain